jgi:site-specific recombinase XerD
MAQHFNISPLLLDEEQILDYLHYLKTQKKTPSDSFFKHTVYGLRYAYRMEGMQDKRIVLPSLEKPKKLPVILSKEEVHRLLMAPKLLKHRLVIGMLYGCGLRCFELQKMLVKDIDFDRRMVHIRQGKGRKDRYVPLSQHLCRGLQTYLKHERPSSWLFTGNHPEGEVVAYSQKGVQWVVRSARKAAGISKEVTTHTLRHTYATHLLEDGLDIVSIKELLGHAHIETEPRWPHLSIYMSLRWIGRSLSLHWTRCMPISCEAYF